MTSVSLGKTYNFLSITTMKIIPALPRYCLYRYTIFPCYSKRGEYMLKEVKVIASFNEEGKITPIWLQIWKEDKSYTYKVLDSVCVATGIKTNEIRYVCKVQGKDKKVQEIQLRYNTRLFTWSVDVNKSLWMAM